jgi:hypothetical protein
MLVQTETKPRIVIVNLPAQPVHVGYETKITLCHKKTAEKCILYIYSFELLSLQDVRLATDKGLGSRWDWHQLGASCSHYAF